MTQVIDEALKKRIAESLIHLDVLVSMTLNNTRMTASDSEYLKEVQSEAKSLLTEIGYKKGEK